MEDFLKDTVSRYDKISEEYHKKYGYLPKSEIPYLRRFLELIDKKKPKILDTGCGTGRDLSFLENFESELYGIDLSDGMLNIAKNNLTKTSLIKGDYRHIPFRENSFDGILNIASLVHLPHNEKLNALAEFYRVLKPEGILYISIQNLLHPDRFVRALKYATPRGVLYDGRYWYFPTKYEMESLVEKAGFDILDSGGMLDDRFRVYAKK